ncbi:structural maintenance of chromosomes protein 5 [Bimuria novae-zelandiae CBS 107.79]|uniref:Structural maintenance of chromosomes protein 5 n=1 Tax=Bimuria novae-zelandiae CBS 107.79 TaxID=1447943 RepID=A0A6A5VN49_9PLEO|nr:structural maintenance of chromosomes protein 5 [Bimuria novae-zelandiae CBS 107.79]
MPGPLTARKRLFAAVSDDAEGHVSLASKRARKDAPGTPSGSGDNGDSDENGHQPGSIVRVKLTNFVTYTSAEFHLGPSLNMIIGPNGTGKSTLVCAICLGLGWSPQYLGRAKDIGEFVKHGSAEAEIEIELAASDKNKRNPVVRRKIQKQGNKTAFWINGQQKTQREVKILAESFSIQINNLCQFLPQDRVVEFARMDSVEMLGETLRAAASNEMVQWYETLKQLRSEQKDAEVEQQNEQRHLRSLQAKQTIQRAEVDRFNQRRELEDKCEALKKCRPFVQARALGAQVTQMRADYNAKKEELEQLKDEAEPTRRVEEEIQAYKEQIEKVVKSRRQEFENQKGHVEAISSQIDRDQQSLGTNMAEIDAEKLSEQQRKGDVGRIEQEIVDLERQYKYNVVEFDEATFRTRIAELRRQKADATRKMLVLKDALGPITMEIKRLRTTLGNQTKQKADLGSDSGQRDFNLTRLSRDTSQGWNWLKNNMGTLSLKDKVFGPPIIECSVPDPKYADAVEAFLVRNEMIAITCMNAEDAKVVQNKLVGKKEAGGLGLHDISVRTVPKQLSSYKSPLTTQELARLGLEGWLIDHIKGPEAVLAMLCEMVKLHQTAFAFKPMSNEQFEALKRHNAQNTHARISRWVSGNTVYVIAARGDLGISTTNTRQLKPGQFFTGLPVDAMAMRHVEDAMKATEQDLALNTEEYDGKKAEFNVEHQKIKAVEDELEQVRKEQERGKKAHAAWAILPRKIADKKSKLDEIRNLSLESNDRVKNIQRQHEDVALALAKTTLAYADEVVQLHSLRESCLEAEVRLIEAISELDGFMNDNREIVEAIQRQEQKIRELKVEARRKSAEQKQYQKECDRTQKEWTRLQQDIIEEHKDSDLEELENEISAANSHLELMEGGDQRVIKTFADREREIEKTQQALDELQEKLDQGRQQIKDIRDQWEPELDRLVETISRGFSDNFQKIGCAGQVGVKKDEDFDKWAIQIEVSFRENEPKAILDSQRQSGGERAVSTIFYLMALQGLARSPFRVVDEINQGMDPRNERMVHERMVDIACAERTSQYFLVTPKLLNGLKFHPKMKVHCIASGEYMPAQGTNLNFQSLAKEAFRIRKGIVAT